MFKWLVKLFGFNVTDDDNKSYDELLKELTSPSKHNEVQQLAYQAIQKNLHVQPGQPHPYEADIQSTCLKVEARIGEFHTSLLKEHLAEAQYLTILLDAGLTTELQKSSSDFIEHSLTAVVSQHESEVARIKSDLIDASQALKVFKGANGITSMAQYPESQSNTLYLIAAFAIIEAIINSFFLKAHNTGMMSLLLALGAAVINVLGNVWLGVRYRNKNLIDPKKATSGKLNFVYSFALIIFLNSAIALYRASVNEFDINADFMFESLILFTFGIGLGIAAFHEGYKMDDPYPEHGPLDRRVKELEKELGEIRTEYAQHSSVLIDTAINNLNKIDQKILSTSANFQAKLPEMSAQIARWANDRSSLDFAYEKLIHIFRITYTANLLSASTNYPAEATPLPANSELELAKSQVEHLIAKNKKLDAAIAKLREQVSKAKKTLNDWIKGTEGQKLLNWP